MFKDGAKTLVVAPGLQLSAISAEFAGDLLKADG
jgi:hypothetical protein